jgi:hypothetical protein
MSDGQPTELVRDGRVETHDRPPDQMPERLPGRPDVPAPAYAGTDLMRADDAGATVQHDLWDAPLLWPKYFTPWPRRHPIDLSRKNAPVYFFAALSVVFAPACLISVSFAGYRLAKRRPHALRGLVVAVVAAGVGVYVALVALRQLGTTGGNWPVRG